MINNLFTSNPSIATLPIVEVLDDIRSALQTKHELILEAPPGAGKTTCVPLALLDEDWLGEQKILMLEPRRLAARAAAERMAQLLDEKVGERVGYRVRLESKISPRTRIEVITEGILTRMLQDDPSLEGIGLIIFDEFHERHLDADLGLALALQGRELFREDSPLKLLVMSATLNTESLQPLLNNAPIVRSQGRQFPVEIIYSSPYKAGQYWQQLDNIVSTIECALREQSGSLLVFLPGQGEIRHCHEKLQTLLGNHDDCVIAPLYGDLSLAQQRTAIAPAKAAQRKIVLATAIAESSLTIEGISAVIDAGLSREAVFDPGTGMTKLQTRRLSRAASEQRAGRAGRLGPGTCYRLWSAEQQKQLRADNAAEIEQAELSALALQLARWGDDELKWLTPPPSGAMAQAKELLQQLGAINVQADAQVTITAHGEHMAALPLHPRLAHMLLRGAELGLATLATDLAAILSERDFYRPSNGEKGCDLQLRIEALRNNSAPHNIKRLAQQYSQNLKSRQNLKNRQGLEPSNKECPTNYSEEQALGLLVALAYPERIAQQRKGQLYRLSNGRSADFRDIDSLQNQRWLAVAQLAGREGNDRIFTAAALDPELFDGPLKALISEQQLSDWDNKSQRFIAEQQWHCGQLLVRQKTIKNIPAEIKQQALARVIRQRGLNLFHCSAELQHWQQRVNFLHHHFPEQWPDLSETALLKNLESWLLPLLDNINTLNDFSKIDFASALKTLLPWPQAGELEKWAPERIKVPSGSAIKIDYSVEPPILAVRLQEMFGCADTPRIAQDRIPLTLHLLSPAQRPLQVTQDLASFWNNAYSDVKKDMKGRYPKHNWPDDPLSAEATRRVKHPKKF